MTVRSFSFLVAFAALMALGGCSPPAPTAQQQMQEVQQTFDGFKDSLALAHAHEALYYVDQASQDYLLKVATSTPNATDSELVQLLRQSMAKLTPGGIQPGFTLEIPLQRVLDAGWVTPSDLGGITMTSPTITPDGIHAQSEALWQGAPTTFQIIFVREAGAWKLDLLNVLPYAQTALSMDRTVKNETEAQQLDRLVGLVPHF